MEKQSTATECRPCKADGDCRRPCYDFDSVIDRHGTGAIKIDALQQLFGRTDITPLWIADMDFQVCPDIVDALRRRFAHPVYGYGCPSDGYWQSIIDWLDSRHGFKVGRDELMFVSGVVCGLAYAVNYFTREGDGIIIQPPVYHPFRMVIEGNRRRVLNNPLIETPDGFYRMDLEGLERIMEAERPRMMVLCNPHNPIGIQWDRETLQRVAELARRHGVIVVSDEIHGDLMLYGREHYPFASVSDDAEAVAVTLGAPSKTFNIPGVVSSWVIVKNPELRDGFFKWLESNHFNEPTFAAVVATEAAYRHGEEWLGQMLEYVEGNIAAVEEALAGEPRIRAVRPQASFLVWLDCRGLGLSHAELIDLFVNKARMALNDGTMFGAEGEGFMRLNVATPRSVLLDSIGRLLCCTSGR